MADVKSYMIVTASYWGFTLTDGALRMLVLLHFHTLGYAPLELAYLFILYEMMGVMTNLCGGWIGARYGLRLTLYSGLSIQVFALCMLALLPADLTVTLSVAYVMMSQALSGVAKDLTKMSSKSAIKYVVAEDNQSTLFKWVSLLTGSKNALKGVGFFLGAFLLATFGFQMALFSMAGGLFIILILCLNGPKTSFGKLNRKLKFKEVFPKTREVNYLSAARVFLFCSRDVWFVVGVPVFLMSHLEWNFNQTGAFMALWIIGYGAVQASVPKIMTKNTGSKQAAKSVKTWSGILMVIPLIIVYGMENIDKISPSVWLIGGLIVFGMVFAVNSAIHSYLIVSYADREYASLNIGFYYMANAVGRCIGTLLSGLLYQYFGLWACLMMSSAMILMAFLLTLPLGLERKQYER